MTPEEKANIDEMSYYEMLKLYRFAPIGDKRFQAESGEYYIKVMNEKEAQLKPGQKVSISKSIGW